MLKCIKSWSLDLIRFFYKIIFCIALVSGQNFLTTPYDFKVSLAPTLKI